MYYRCVKHNVMTGFMYKGGSYKTRNGTERNGINWGAHYSSFIEQALYFYDFDDITNLVRLLYKKH